MVDFSPCASDASNVRFWIEDAIKDHVPYLRQCICKAWNESGRYQSVLRAYKKKPLKFVSEEEREAFLAFCEKEISNCPFAMNPYEYPEDTTELIGALVDDLNGCEWESSMTVSNWVKASVSPTPRVGAKLAPGMWTTRLSPGKSGTSRSTRAIRSAPGGSQAGSK